MLLVLIASTLSACSGNGAVETPTSATTTSTVAEALVHETFEGTLPVGGTHFYSFSVATYGTVNITLEAVGGQFVPSTVMLGLGFGTPAAEDCVTTATVNSAPGTGPHLTGVYEAGVYCAKVWDVGNLFAPADFRMGIAHP